MTKNAQSRRPLSQPRPISTGDSIGKPVEPRLDDFFGPPPILEGESEENYHDLYRRVRVAVAPTDIIEELWVRDIADLFWETLRFRRLKTKFLTVAAPHGMRATLQSLKKHNTLGFSLTDGWAQGDRRVRNEVKKILSNAGLDSEMVTAQTLAIKLDEIERIDRMIMQAEIRRNAALREIDRRRGHKLERLHNLVEEAEDAQFEEIAADAGAIVNS